MTVADEEAAKYRKAWAEGDPEKSNTFVGEVVGLIRTIEPIAKSSNAWCKRQACFCSRAPSTSSQSPEFIERVARRSEGSHRMQRREEKSDAEDKDGRERRCSHRVRSLRPTAVASSKRDREIREPTVKAASVDTVIAVRRPLRTSPARPARQCSLRRRQNDDEQRPGARPDADGKGQGKGPLPEQFAGQLLAGRRYGRGHSARHDREMRSPCDALP